MLADDVGDEPDPRWSLANERTLLAYNRTALALIVAGMAVSGSRSVAETPRWFATVGLPLIALGGLVAVSSRRRFRAVQRAMRQGRPLPVPSVVSTLPWGIAAVAVAGLAAAAAQLF
jgi:putative membrane protein